MFTVFFEYKQSNISFFINPPVLFTLAMIVRIVIGESFLFWDKTVSNSELHTANLAFLYTLIAIHSMFIGFSLFRSARLFKELINKYQHRYVPLKNIAILIIIAIATIFIGLITGTFGYSYEFSDYISNFQQFIALFSNLSIFAVVLLVFFYYDNKKIRKYIYAVILVFFLLGLGYGHKSTAVIYILMFIITLYFKYLKFNIRLLLFLVVGIIIAYIIVEPFRIYYNLYGQYYNTKNIDDYFELFLNSSKFGNRNGASNLVDIGIQFINRNSYIKQLSMAINYADSHNYSFENGWKNIILSPLYAIIPRFLWTSKPEADIGLWFTKNVVGLPYNTSTGFTPQGYLYLLSRVLGIIIGFVIIGIFQRLLFNSFYKKSLFMIVYITIFWELSIPGDLIWAYFSGIIQNSILLTIILILISRSYSSKENQKLLDTV
jgi:hypothetical protein